LPYVNNVPHLGNIIGCVLSADVFARYACPRIFREPYRFLIIFTTNLHFFRIAQDIFLKLHENGYTSSSSIDQLHCQNCDKFLADRFVTGICPFCAYDDARGDQCDSCGRLINAVELKSPKCHICRQEPKVRQSTHIFLHLDALQDVRKYVESEIAKPNTRWSSNAVAIVKGWIKGGLEKRCITRDLKWGTAVPIPGYENKVCVLCVVRRSDRISFNYEVSLVQFHRKGLSCNDNVAFHGVMFPCTQLGARDNYTIVNHVCATEYLNYEDTKFSKSRNTGVFGDNAKETGIEADVWRFYLLYMRPESQDTSFSWDDFALKVRCYEIYVYVECLRFQLFVQVSARIRSQCGAERLPVFSAYPMSYLKPGHKIGTPKPLFVKMESAKVAEWKAKFGGSALTNDLDKKRKGELCNRLDNCLLNGSESCHSMIDAIQKQLVEAETAAGIKQVPVPSIHPATVATEVKQANEKKPTAAPGGGKKTESTSVVDISDAAADDAVDVGRLDLRVGRIVKCEKHPDADALYVEQIDIGESAPRTVVSGLVRHVPLDQMQNRLVVVLCNLKPAKMRGVESRAMVMCASTPEKVEIMEVDPSAQPGTPVTCPPYTHRPDAQLNPKKKIWETVAEDLKVNADGYAVWKDCPLLVGGSTKMTAPTLRGVPIK
uniref:Methionyl-tRNA synthetase n=1 Tax=Heligmosomoides polygyrus TaxID=6339 RepID=A0A8L8KBT2_HELPZ